VTTFLDRILRRPPARKATNGGPWLAAYQRGEPNLTSVLGLDNRSRMNRYLAAYSVGWFHKGGRKISTDVAGLEPTLAYEDSEGDNEADVVAPANNIPFDRLDPLEQFLRLMERPNPGQTGRMLRQKTQIRLDFAGAAFWYLEGGEGGQLPTAIYGINPARMEPSYAPGGELVGWVMDKGVNGSLGIPFTADEILLFTTACAGDDWYGTSIVEAVWTQVPLTDMIARHTADVLTMGGRLAGMVWPKDRALDTTEFEEAQRAWRNVATDPNAARRLLLFPEPMEYAGGASTPKEIGIPELAQLSRDEITTAFPINPYVLGVPVLPGLSSGETLKYVSRDYWRNSVHDRAELIEETIQVGLIPRYEAAVGRPLDFDLEEPDMDGPTEVIEKVGALKGLISLGFDPKAAIAKVGLDDVEWVALPATADPNAPPAPATELPTRVSVNDSNLADASNTTQVVSKAVKARRDEVVGETLPGFIPRMSEFLEAQRARVLNRIEAVFGPLTKTSRKALPTEWWDPKTEDELLTDTLHTLYLQLSRSGLTVVANEVDRTILPERIKRVTESVLRNAGERITGINETTRQAIAEELAVGVQRGYSLNQLLYGVPREDYTGVRDLHIWGNYRSELIARTETMRAYNESALHGYKEYNVREVIASDGDVDEPCRARDGRTFSVDEAFGIEDHPNGTLDWIPVVPDRKSADRGELFEFATKALELAARPQPAPTFLLGTDSVVQSLQPQTVNVEPPDLDPIVAEIKALGDRIEGVEHIVNVAPIVKLPTVKTPPVQDVRIVESTLPPKKRTIRRDFAGRIAEISEE